MTDAKTTNHFKRMKQEIMDDFPHINTLPLWKRVRAFFTFKGRHELTETDNKTYWRKQHATIVQIDGKDCVYCWGYSND